MKKDTLDFKKWLALHWDWKEILFRVNTDEQYKHKQNLTALFWNIYIYYPSKIEGYFQEYNKIPMEVFEELIFEFRQSFPKHGRVEGVNYFDDLIEQLIARYKSSNISGFTHRENALAHLIQVDKGEAQPIARKDQRPKKFEQAFDSLNPRTKSRDNPFREANQKELENVILILEKRNSYKALNEAKERLKKLLKSQE